LEKILSELRLSADKALQDNENLKAELSKAKVHMGAAAKLTEAESKSINDQISDGQQNSSLNFTIYMYYINIVTLLHIN
jgi:hypothetical protein